MEKVVKVVTIETHDATSNETPERTGYTKNGNEQLFLRRQVYWLLYHLGEEMSAVDSVAFLTNNYIRVSKLSRVSAQRFEVDSYFLSSGCTGAERIGVYHARYQRVPEDEYSLTEVAK